LRRTLKMKKLITLLVATLALALVAFTPDIASAGRGHGGHGWKGGGHGWHGGGRARLRLSRLARLRLGLGRSRRLGAWRRHLYRRLRTPLLVPELRLLSLPLPLGLLGPEKKLEV
jgi:hypothetical protein